MAPSRVGPLIMLGVLLGLLLPAAPAIAAPVCVTSAPLSAAYTVTVCLNGIAEEPTVSGDVAVTADVVSTGAAVSRVEWFLGTEYLLRDVSSPYDLVLPTAKFADGTYELSARVLMADSFVATRPVQPLTFVNGLSSPPTNSNQRAPYEGAAGDESLLVAATGDGAGGRPMAATVAATIASWSPDMFLYLGDVYEKGTFTEHYNFYGHGGSGLSALRSVTNPIVGNHEYLTPGAAGYFDYWDNLPHHYSVQAAGWHLIGLDSTTDYGQLGTTTPQYQWLQQQLASTDGCTLAFMHHPRFSIGGHGDQPAMDPIWRALAADGVDIVLTGHEHHYQRWAPLDANGQPATGGITQFIAGAGGQSMRPFERTDSRVTRSLTGDQAYGALRLTLESGGAAYEYVNTGGVVKDSGTIDCDPVVAPPTTTTFNFTGSGGAGAWRTHTFSVTEPGDLTATLDWTNAAADLNLSLYNSAGKRIARATGSTQKPERITYALNAGTYKFGVGFRLASTNYTLQAVVDHGGGGGGPPPPTATITAPAAGQTVKETVPVTVAATSANDPAGSLVVEARVGDGAWQTATYNAISNRYVWSWDTSSTPDGPAVIQARATDSLAQTTAAANVAVTVDNVADPTTTFTFTGSGNPGNWRTHDFVVPAAGALTATLDWDNASADLNESLYNSAGTRIAYATGSTAKPEIIQRDVTAGTYRIGIGFKLASAAYTLSVVVTHP